MNKKLRALIDRAERLIAEREEVAESIRDLRKEVKSGGWDAAQIMRLAQLSHDDKKRAKLAATNEMLALYNRESGLGLDLGLDESEADSSVRKDEGETGPTRERKAGHKAAAPASDTPSPAGGPSLPSGPTQAAASLSPDAVPAGEPIHETDHRSDARAMPEAGCSQGEAAPADPVIGPNVIKMAAAIAARPVSPEVASIAMQTAQLVDEGRFKEAGAVVTVVKAATGDDNPMPPHLRWGTPENRKARGLEP